MVGGLQRDDGAYTQPLAQSRIGGGDVGSVRCSGLNEITLARGVQFRV